MRHIILLMAAFIAIATHASEKSDTMVVEKPRTITVISNDSLLKISIDGTATNPSYHYDAMLRAVDSNYVSSETLGRDFEFGIGTFGKHKKTMPQSSLNLRFLIGSNGANGGPAELSTQYGTIGEIGFWFDYQRRPWRNGHCFSIGYGLDWRKYRMTNRWQFVKADNGNVSLQQLDPQAEPKFSRILLTNFMFPIQYGYTHKGWGFSLGPVLNINTYSSILTKYRLDGVKHKEKHKKIHPTKLTVDFMGTLATPWLDFYFKYNPCNVLDSTYGPEFQSLSFGVLF